MSKIFIIIGCVFIAIGIGIYLFDKVSWFGKLPGDILIKKDNFTFYFPLATCIIISLIISFILFLWNQR